MNTHIPTLLQREWMQHKRGWLIAAFAPPLLFLAVLPFGTFTGLPTESPELMAVGMVLVTTAVVYCICMLIALFQLPGLARRDTQDRSIEFWLSLPGRPSESVLSTVLAHAWLAPLGGAVVGLLFGIPIAMGVLGSKLGFADVLAVNWGEVILASTPLLVRGLAVPVVLIGGGVATTVLHKAYDISWPLEALSGLSDRINHTLVHDGKSLANTLHSGDNLITWALRDLGATLAELASLQFLGWAAIAAAAFALIVMKRARGG
jgi:hypothetical protein